MTGADRRGSFLAFLDEVQSIGRNGLAYATDPFDRERYERLVQLAARHYGDTLHLPPEEIRRRWSRELGHVTPKLGAEAAIFDPAGRILLLRRADDGRWGLPGGWLEPNETPEECAIRETREETGLEVRTAALVGVFTRKAADGHAPQSTVAVVYLCTLAGGSLDVAPESTAAAWYPLDAVPDWHGWHREHAQAADRKRREVEFGG